MSTKVIAALAASTAIAFFAIAPANAESIPQEQIDQFSGSDKPDVDAGASKGRDESIVKQEQNQFSNEPAKDLDKNVTEGGGKTLPEMEQDGIPH
jgi:hypothetical protein